MEKNRFQLVVLFCLGVFFLFPMAMDGRAEKVKLRVIVQSGQIRLKPDVDSLAIREVRMGTILDSEAKEGAWYKINLPLAEGQLNVVGFIQESDVEAFVEEIQKTENASPITSQKPPSTPKPSSFKVGIGLKFSGGAAYLLNGAGDFENLRQGREAYYEAWGAEEEYSTSFDWKKKTFIPDLNFDLIVNIGRYLGIGFGLGFIKASINGDYSIDYDYSHPLGNYLYDVDEDYVRDYRLTAIPIRSNLYFFIPLKNLSFFGYGGIGYYSGKLTHAYSYNDYYYYESPAGSPSYKHEKIYEWNADEESTSSTIGFQGGFGFEFKIPPFILLGVEFFGRWIDFKEWEGTRPFSWEEQDRYWNNSLGWYSDITTNDSGKYEGKLWIYELYNSYMDDSYANMWIRDDKPSGSNYFNVNPAAINLNTAGILFFIRIYFGLF
jgi:hypothetical protein